MLFELNISNFALIDNLQINFSDKLNILTGETGAGKSIVIDALNALLGEKFGSEFVKTGERKAKIEGLFKISNNSPVKKDLEEIGIEENEIFITREITSSGTSTYRIQGKSIPLNILKKISANLVDIHGQHEHQSLLKIDNHLFLLDSFGGVNLQKIKENVEKNFYQLKKLEDEYKKLEEEKNEMFSSLELKKFQLEEIEKAKLIKGEDTELEEKRILLQNFEKLTECVEESYNALYGENSVNDKLVYSIDKLKEVKHLDKIIEELQKNLENLFYQIEEQIRLLQKYKENLEFNPEELEEIEERLDLINSLKKKYGGSINSILDYKKKTEEYINNVEFSKDILENILKEIDEVKNKLTKFAKNLSLKRSEIAKKLEKEVKRELKNLGMEYCDFKVDIKEKEQIGPSGFDRVEFLISPNPGEDLKPLAKIASGGEMARIMLSLKSILSSCDPVSTLVFDEIDTGIGGKTAEMIGKKLSLLSSSHQVICVTHLPIIASFADSHYYVEKEVIRGKTKVKVEKLKLNDRIKEIARMMRGEKIGEITLKDAEDLLNKAKDGS